MKCVAANLLLLAALIGYSGVCADTIGIAGSPIIFENRNLLLQCNLSAGPQDGPVNWDIQSERVTVNMTLPTTRELNITTVMKDDAGLYRCCLNQASSCAELNVYVLYVDPATSFVASKDEPSGRLTLAEGSAFSIKLYHQDTRAQVTVVDERTATPLCNHFRHRDKCEQRKKGKSTKFTVHQTVPEDSGWFVINVALNDTIVTYRMHILIEDTGNVDILHIVIATDVTLLGICCIVLCMWLRRRKTSNSANKKHDADTSTLAEFIPAEYIFPRRKIKVGKKIGEGEYGVVMMALAQDILVHEPWTTVAVKMIKRTSSKSALIRELKVVIELGQHLNVVNFLGVTSHSRKGKFMMIFEYCPYGSVLDYMQKNASSFVATDDSVIFRDGCATSERTPEEATTHKFTKIDLINWAAQIANGMSYLASKNVLHGDLAARNVLLCADSVVKIGDFGLARIMRNGANYKGNSEAMLPVKWLALESISQHLFSVKTDVWAYGVLVWELFSLGAPPYPGMQLEEIPIRVRDGYRMDKPDHADDEIHDIMLSCWCVNPDRRPSFAELTQHFDRMLPEELRKLYVRLNDRYLRTNYLRMQQLNRICPPALDTLECVTPRYPTTITVL